MNKITSIILTLALLVAIGIIAMGKGDTELVNNVEIRDGVQYINIKARGGYSPRVSTAKSGIPTKVIMETEGTFDCSAALVIRSENYQNILSPNSKTEIDVGAKNPGETLDGSCSMGMYNFRVNFE